MDINQAIELLNGDKTLVLFHGEDVQMFSQRGVLPLTNAYESKKDYSSFIAVDKVVGRGAAFMYILLKIQRIHAQVISKPALEILEKYPIAVTYDEVVPFIQNRTRDGFCLMESATLSCTDPLDAYQKIKQKQAELRK